MVETHVQPSDATPCHTPDCARNGVPSFMGYCESCAIRLGITASTIAAQSSSAAAAARPPSPVRAIAACATPDCEHAALDIYLGYCGACAERLGIRAAVNTAGGGGAAAGANNSAHSNGNHHQQQGAVIPRPTAGGDQGGATASPNKPVEGTCRSGCGFFGNPAYSGLCSGCWKKIVDDPFLKAVVGVAVDRTDFVQTYLDVGGSLLREITAEETTKLCDLGFYCTKGQTLTRLANDFGQMHALAFLLQRDTSMTVVSDSNRRQTLSTLLPKSTFSTGEEQHTTTEPGGRGGAADDDGHASFAAENVRLELISTEAVRPDGLVHFWAGWFDDIDDSATEAAATAAPGGDSAWREELKDRAIGKSFALPAVVRRMSAAERQKVLWRYLEQEDMLDDIDKAVSFFSSVPHCDAVVPVYTVADLNCLMHAAFTGMVGVRDGVYASDDPTASSATTRTVLRNAVRNSIIQCDLLKQVLAPGSTSPSPAPPTPSSQAPATDAPGASPRPPPSPMPCPVPPGVDPDRLRQLMKDIEQGKASLEGGHVFALANVLRRPIVVYAHEGLEGEFRKELPIPFRVSGLYLPLLWPPHRTLPDPLVVVFSSGHFSALVPCLDDQPTAHAQIVVDGRPYRVPVFDAHVPLCDEKFVPLPIHLLHNCLDADLSHLVALLQSCRGDDDDDDDDGGASSGNKKKPTGAQHSVFEAAVLKAYLRGVRRVPLIEGMDDDDVAGDDDEEGGVPRITLCTQRHVLRHQQQQHRQAGGGDGDGAAAPDPDAAATAHHDSNEADDVLPGSPTQTQQYVTHLWHAVESLVAQAAAAPTDAARDDEAAGIVEGVVVSPPGGGAGSHVDDAAAVGGASPPVCSPRREGQDHAAA